MARRVTAKRQGQSTQFPKSTPGATGRPLFQDLVFESIDFLKKKKSIIVALHIPGGVVEKVYLNLT